MTTVDALLRKLNNCANYNSIFAMERDFNAVGLTLQTTPQNWMFLCRVEDGQPVANTVIDDYIFIAPLGNADHDISARSLEIIKNFVQSNAGEATTVKAKKRVWQNGVRIYDKAISIMHEDIHRVAQTLID